MMNLTSRLAIRICHLPDFDFEWSDTSHKCPRESLSVDDFLLSEEDFRILNEHAVNYMIGFLVESFSSLSDLHNFIPASDHFHPVTKSKVVPMKILFYDENYKSETIKILSEFITDADLTGSPQVHCTCIYMHMLIRAYTAYSTCIIYTYMWD